MKAVVLEVRGKEAVVLNTAGQVIRIRQKNLKTGDTIELSDEMMKEKVISWSKVRRYGAVAAAAALILGSGGMYSYNNVIACSYVSLDINPSIEYVLNRQNLILDVEALNEEAEEIVSILKENNIKKNTLSQAMEKTTEILEEYGYIDEEETDYILLNVSCDSEERRTLLKEEASTIFNNLNKTNSENINVTMTESSISERKDAKALGISSGEYQEIRKIKENETSTEKPEVSVDDIDKYKDFGVKDLLESSGELKGKDQGSRQNGQSEAETFTSGQSEEKKDAASQNGAEQSEGRKSGTSQSGKEQTENNKSGNSQSGNEQSGNDKSGNNQTGKEQTGNDQSRNGQSGKTQTENNQSGNNQSMNEQPGNTQSESAKSDDVQSENSQQKGAGDGGTVQNNSAPEQYSGANSDMQMENREQNMPEGQGQNGDGNPGGQMENRQ